LMRLFLGRNMLGDPGVACLAEGLKGSTCLQVLCLEENCIGDEGASVLADGLQEPRWGADARASLRSLNLANNAIGDKGAIRLAGCMRANPRLESLDLGRNAIEDAGAAELARGVCACPGLRCLWLDENLIGREGAAAFSRCWIAGAKLEKLDLTKNAFEALCGGRCEADVQSQSRDGNTHRERSRRRREDVPSLQEVISSGMLPATVRGPRSSRPGLAPAPQLLNTTGSTTEPPLAAADSLSNSVQRTGSRPRQELGNTGGFSSSSILRPSSADEVGSRGSGASRSRQRSLGGGPGSTGTGASSRGRSPHGNHALRRTPSPATRPRSSSPPPRTLNQLQQRNQGKHLPSLSSMHRGSGTASRSNSRDHSNPRTLTSAVLVADSKPLGEVQQRLAAKILQEQVVPATLKTWGALREAVHNLDAEVLLTVVLAEQLGPATGEGSRKNLDARSTILHHLRRELGIVPDA